MIDRIEFNADTEVFIAWSGDVGTLFQADINDAGNFVSTNKFNCARCGELLTTANADDIEFPTYCTNCVSVVDSEYEN